MADVFVLNLFTVKLRFNQNTTCFQKSLAIILYVIAVILTILMYIWTKTEENFRETRDQMFWLIFAIPIGIQYVPFSLNF